MAIEVIYCPQCRAEVRVPDTLFGTVVRCPRCRANFRAPVRNSDGALVGIEVIPDAVEPVAVRLVENPMKGHGVVLVLIGLAGILVDGLVVYQLAGEPQAIVAQMHAILADPNHPITKQLGDRLKPEEITEAKASAVGYVFAAFLGLSILVLFGGVAMVRQRFWCFCVLASVLAMVIPLTCCLAGLPVGLWSLIRLFDPAVKRLFR